MDIIFCGTLMHSTKENALEILEDHYIGIKNGQIKFVADRDGFDKIRSDYDLRTVRHLKRGQFLIPGMIDTHIHAPQYPNAGTKMDLPLLDWLDKYTFPLESKFSNPEFAESCYRKLVARTLRCGTTTACYFATIHADSSLKLAEICGEFGQRAYIGKVSMDISSHNNYKETTEDSIRDTRWFIEAVQNLNNSLLTPCVTPRFAVNCTPSLLSALGKIAKEYGGLPIQTHINETVREQESVLKLFPTHTCYADVYDSFGLLTDKTVMAHCVFMQDDEFDSFKTNGTGIAHCPTSNIIIESGIMDLRKTLNKGVKTGLGTDISGGYSASIPAVIRDAIVASKTLAMDKSTSSYKSVDFKEAFRLATLGGSQVLGLDDRIGNFEVGKEFDALLVDLTVPCSPCDIFAFDTTEELLQKFIFIGDDRNIVEIYVNGHMINDPRNHVRE
ncbi:guanine deaminase-like [Anneissia japonica]|uniref:guanine deaminase-like n=1 Tax=Anneissia japonica TaxID=1529436 RepID=UPI001425BABE|nr:guanine deaminase-like [Anneissia japonica]